MTLVVGFSVTIRAADVSSALAGDLDKNWTSLSCRVATVVKGRSHDFVDGVSKASFFLFSFYFLF